MAKIHDQTNHYFFQSVNKSRDDGFHQLTVILEKRSFGKTVILKKKTKFWKTAVLEITFILKKNCDFEKKCDFEKIVILEITVILVIILNQSSYNFLNIRNSRKC